MKRLFFSALVLVLAISLGPTAFGGFPKPGGSENLITMNFQDVDISVLAKFISEITGKNFVLDESVRGKVSIVSPSKVTPEQAYSIFKSVLALKGFTTVAAGPIIKIVPSRDVRGSAALTQSQEPALQGGTDEYVTRMIKLRNVDSASLVNVIQPMISRDGLVAAFPETNTLIITDDAWNVQRLLQIIGSLDAQGLQQSVVVIPLKLAYADDLAPKIEQIMGERASSGAGRRPGYGVVAPSAEAPSRAFKIVPDERTNSLIVLAGPLQMKQIKELVDKLDIHSPSETSRVHVYYLKFAQSLEMVSVLNALLGGGGGGPGMLSPQTGRGSLGRSSGMMGMGMGMGGMGGFGSSMGGLGGMGGFGSSMGGFGSSMGGLGGGMGMGGMGMGGMGMGGMGMGGRASGSLGGAGSGPASAMATGGPGTEFEQAVRITADPATNSLVVSASPQDYSTLQTIISQLDIPRRQVYVQAVIVEVSIQRMRQLGISYYGTTNLGGNTLGVGQFDYGTLSNFLTNPLGATGLTFGLASGSMCTINSAIAAAASTTTGTTSTSVTVPCDIALITAIETDTHSNVLSAPTLLTTDNEEATIVVGQNVPFLSSATATSALSGQIFNSVDRQNVGITLDIVPQITEGGYIKLDVYEEVSAVIASTENNPLGPTTTIRSASTTVLVQNHRTTVIGGLLSDELDLTNNGVPFLSNIPVLGNFFSQKEHDQQKTDLLVFLTPHVILNREDLRELSLDERQKFLQTLGRKELHQMPLDQVRELFKPSFSISVPPGAEYGPAPAPETSSGFGLTTGAGSAGPSGNFSPTPLNTYEVGPGARNITPSGPSMVAPASAAIAPAGPLAGAPPASTSTVGTYGSPASAGAQAEAGTHKSNGTLDSVKGLFDLR